MPKMVLIGLFREYDCLKMSVQEFDGKGEIRPNILSVGFRKNANKNRVVLQKLFQSTQARPVKTSWNPAQQNSHGNREIGRCRLILGMDLD